MLVQGLRQRILFLGQQVNHTLIGTYVANSLSIVFKSQIFCIIQTRPAIIQLSPTPSCMQRVPLTAEIIRDQTGYSGRILEITGINSQGTTADEAYHNLLRATQGLLRYKLPDRTMADVLIVREDRKH